VHPLSDYIFGFESLRDYVQEIESRNKAFAAITRSKAWVRITGVGQAMDDVKTEIDAILANLPRFRFTFPDLSTLRRLDAETSRRRREVNRAKDSLAGLLTVDPKALDAALTPEQRRRLRKLLNEASGEDY